MIAEIYLDKVLASKVITYMLANGKEDSIPVDVFLDYNKDPDYLREILLPSLTVETLKWFKMLLYHQAGDTGTRVLQDFSRLFGFRRQCNQRTHAHN
ncbi:MAG: hypothetical protein C5B49_13920 [Bdellovibrio sp.]|nr:MAG: hypothetical protein C5B49_13920 [Bdellovibrio sp.]